jgi:hypothetical protein
MTENLTPVSGRPIFAEGGKAREQEIKKYDIKLSP